jgi:hypothetical protein
MKQIAIVILETLSDQGLIKTSIKQVGLKIHDEKGELFVSCANLPADENNLFIQSLQEFLDPVENPRYLLVKRSRFLKRIRQTDYFAIPSAISPNKKRRRDIQGTLEAIYRRLRHHLHKERRGPKSIAESAKIRFLRYQKESIQTPLQVAIVFFRRLRLRKSKSVFVPATWK